MARCTGEHDFEAGGGGRRWCVRCGTPDITGGPPNPVRLEPSRANVLEAVLLRLAIAIATGTAIA